MKIKLFDHKDVLVNEMVIDNASIEIPTGGYAEIEITHNDYGKKYEISNSEWSFIERKYETKSK